MKVDKKRIIKGYTKIGPMVYYRDKNGLIVFAVSLN